MPGSVPSLSWRVRILPELGHQELYDQFNLNESWQSPNNSRLIPLMPDVFRHQTTTGRTRFLGLNDAKVVKFLANKLIDPPDLTAIIGYVGPHCSMPWTASTYDPIAAAKFFGSTGCDHKTGLITAFGDATIRTIPHDFHLSKIKAIMGGEDGAVFDLNRAIKNPRVPLSLVATRPLIPIHANSDLLTRSGIAPGDGGDENDSEDAKKVKEVVRAFLAYESKFKCFAPRKNREENDETFEPYAYHLSWRVHVLPLLGYEKLYEQFRLDEPWDSPHNQQLIPFMPDCFRAVGDPKDSVTTRIQMFCGPETLFADTTVMTNSRTIADGAVNTIALMQMPKGVAVTWTEPRDYEIDQIESLPQIPGQIVGFLNGRVSTLPSGVDAQILRKLITPRGHEDVSKWLEPEQLP